MPPLTSQQPHPRSGSIVPGQKPSPSPGQSAPRFKPLPRGRLDDDSWVSPGTAVLAVMLLVAGAVMYKLATGPPGTFAAVVTSCSNLMASLSSARTPPRDPSASLSAHRAIAPHTGRRPMSSRPDDVLGAFADDAESPRGQPVAPPSPGLQPAHRNATRGIALGRAPVSHQRAAVAAPAPVSSRQIGNAPTPGPASGRALPVPDSAFDGADIEWEDDDW